MYVVYGKPGCTFCVQAMKLLESKNIAATYVDVTEDAEAYQKLVDGGFRTVPQIYHDSEYVGGFDKLQERLSGA